MADEVVSFVSSWEMILLVFFQLCVMFDIFFQANVVIKVKIWSGTSFAQGRESMLAEPE